LPQLIYNLTHGSALEKKKKKVAHDEKDWTVEPAPRMPLLLLETRMAILVISFNYFCKETIIKPKKIDKRGKPFIRKSKDYGAYKLQRSWCRIWYVLLFYPCTMIQTDTFNSLSDFLFFGSLVCN
jgi:hypothetical protein